MTNIGTRAGPLMPSGGLIAGDPNVETPVISEYGKYYGTYSGADIKVVVHYPQDPTIERALNLVRAEIEAELLVKETQVAVERQELDNLAFINAVEELNSLRAELESIDEEINKIKDLPTSKVLGEITSIAISNFRDKVPCRSLGSVYPKSFTRGPRTIGGTMVFTIFHEHVFHELMQIGLGYYSTGSSDFDKYVYSTMLADQLPPLDISLIFANEYGAISHMGLWGVEFFQEGMTFSIEDIYSENQLHYVARDFDPLRIVSQRQIDGTGVRKEWNQTATTMLREKLITSHRIRRNPFI